MMFALGIMLMIAAQVARGEMAPGVNKYMKEMNKIRESAFFAKYQRQQDRKRACSMSKTAEKSSTNLMAIEEQNLFAEV